MLNFKSYIRVLVLKWLSGILVTILFKIYSGDNFFFILWNMDKYSKEQLRHNIDNLSSMQIAVLLSLRSKIRKLMED